jgi:hypothetical protein
VAGQLGRTSQRQANLLYFRDLDEFGPTIIAAADQLGISPTAVEKDYWATQVLLALQRGFGSDFVFKGGTSLSKGYGILERFSDDLDILVLPRGRGKGSTDRLMKSMGQAAAEAAGGQAQGYGGSETGIHRAYRVSYPAVHEPTDAIATSVLLEMGVRGGPNPREQVSISGLLSAALAAADTDLREYDDLSPFEVALLHPGRTLLEKLYVIDGLARKVSAGKLNTEKLRRNGRHFYDVHKLLGSQQVLDLLADGDLVEQIMTSIEETSQEQFQATEELRPAGGFAASEAFASDSDVSRQMRRAYERIMPALYFGADPLPEWDDICARVQTYRDLL